MASTTGSRSRLRSRARVMENGAPGATDREGTARARVIGLPAPTGGCGPVPSPPPPTVPSSGRRRPGSEPRRRPWAPRRKDGVANIAIIDDPARQSRLEAGQLAASCSLATTSAATCLSVGRRPSCGFSAGPSAATRAVGTTSTATCSLLGWAELRPLARPDGGKALGRAPRRQTALRKARLGCRDAAIEVRPRPGTSAATGARVRRPCPEVHARVSVARDRVCG